MFATSAVKVSSNDDPRKFFIHTLLNAKVPLWTFSPLRNEGDMRCVHMVILHFNSLASVPVVLYLIFITA